MDASQYWPFACEYSIWNAADTALQFWIADLKPHILSNTTDRAYAGFFYSNYTLQLPNLPEETFFSSFFTTLNSAFETELAQEDKGYKNGSESFSIPTPLSRALRVYYVSTMEDLFFDPANFDQSPATPEQHEKTSPHRYRHHRDDDTTSTEEHFQTTLLDDQIWSEDPILDRPLCIHERPH